MIKRLSKILIFPILLLVLMVSSVFAVEVFTIYNTNIKINKNETMEVEKYITLQNVHIVGIVPGRVEFKIPKSSDDSVSEVTIENFKALDGEGRAIPSNLFETKDNTVIALDLFTPLLPGFQQKINLKYTVKYDSSGLFFKNLQVPVREETTIPIETGKFNITLPQGRSFTFLSYPGNVTVNGNNAVIEITDNSPASVRFEYSFIPSGFFGIKGSYVFWILINMILLGILAFEIRRELMRHHSNH